PAVQVSLTFLEFPRSIQKYQRDATVCSAIGPAIREDTYSYAGSHRWKRCRVRWCRTESLRPNAVGQGTDSVNRTSFRLSRANAYSNFIDSWQSGLPFARDAKPCRTPYEH